LKRKIFRGVSVKTIRNFKVSIDNEKGGTLIFIIMIFMVVAILLASVQTVFMANLRQAKVQEEDIEAYYLAYSGVEMAFSALIDNSFALMNNLKNGTVASYTENNINLGDGEIDVVAVKTSDTGFTGWIKITATATVNATGNTYTRTMYFDPKDVTKKVWKNN